MSGQDIVTPAPVPAPRVYCDKPNCKKDYKSRSGLLNHNETAHKNELKIQSPLGIFPSSNSARVLFDDEDRPSTQGNSNGEINSPKVQSIVRFLCGVCDLNFSQNEEAKLHMSEVHKKKTDKVSDDPTTPSFTADKESDDSTTPTPTADKESSDSATPNPTRQLYSPNTVRQLNEEDEVLEDAKIEQELYKEIFKITEHVIAPEKEEETREDIKNKMIRFKTIKEKKEKLYEEAREKLKTQEDLIKSLKH